MPIVHANSRAGKATETHYRLMAEAATVRWPHSITY